MERNFPFIRILQCIVVLGMFALVAWLYPSLPDVIPVHWGISGEPNGWAPKMWSAWLLPIIGLLLTLLFPLFAKIDPKAENYKEFARAWNVLQLGIVLFFAYVEGITFYTIVHPAHNALLGRDLLIGIGFLFIVLGNYMGKIRQNFFIGVRTPWTLSDPDVWQKSQRIGGWTFVIGGIATMVLSWLFPMTIGWFIGVIVAIVIIPVLSSYVLYQRKKKI
ncbi:MAG TPA: SdpI family protein [Candidatus Peribacteraceae bacterium]|nr:SdpI family protein [Candidatus Peribacteraceae bacterium]